MTAVRFACSFCLMVLALPIISPAQDCIVAESTLHWIGGVDTPSHAHAVAVAGDFACVADVYYGLQMVDVSDPTAPALAGCCTAAAGARSVVVAGGYAYVADVYTGLLIVDITDPWHPTLVSSLDPPGIKACGIDLIGHHAFIADYNLGVQIVDVADPEHPVLVGGANTPDQAYGVDAAGDYAYVADGYSGLQIVDVSDPAHPVLVGGQDTPIHAWGVEVAGDRAYVADDAGGLVIVDVADPAHPSLLGVFDTSGHAFAVTVMGDYAFVADDPSGVQVVDVADPLNPMLVGTFDTPGGAIWIDVADGHAFVADRLSGLQVYGINCLEITGTVSSDCEGSLAGIEVEWQGAGGETCVAITGTDGGFRIAGVPPRAPCSITVAVPEGYVPIAPATGRFEFTDPTDDAVADFALGCLLDLTGTVSSDCQGAMAGLTVGIDIGGDYLTALTDAGGAYCFDGLPYGAAVDLACVLPLGFTAVDPPDGHASFMLTADTVLDIELACVAASGEARGAPYWRHQAAVYTRGWGHAQESQADMETNFPAAIFGHFHENALNSIAVAGVTYMGEDPPVPLDLETILSTLTVQGNQPMAAHAKQQYLALLLNVASDKLRTWTPVSADGRSASEALQYFADLINDGIAANDRLAKNLCIILNLGLTLPAALIPAGYSPIYYALGEGEPRAARFAFEGVHPNPFNPKTRLCFSLPAADTYLLDFHDVTGRLVCRLEGQGRAGLNQVDWVAHDERDHPLASGIYYCTLRAAGREATRKLTLLR